MQILRFLFYYLHLKLIKFNHCFSDAPEDFILHDTHYPNTFNYFVYIYIHAYSAILYLINSEYIAIVLRGTPLITPGKSLIFDKSSKRKIYILIKIGLKVFFYTNHSDEKY